MKKILTAKTKLLAMALALCGIAACDTDIEDMYGCPTEEFDSTQTE